MTLIKMASMLRWRFISNARGRNFTWYIALTALLLGARPGSADLVSPYGGETAPNFVELSVEDDHVRVILEIDLDAYPHFVTPDDGSGVSLAERTGANFLVSADNVTLDRVINAIDVRPRVVRQTTASKVIAPRPRSSEVVYVDMEFPFHGQPERITFTPPLSPDGLPLASIGLMAEHTGVPVTDYRYLSQVETMLPDWDDSWFTTFENPNLTRHHKSPLMSFLSMEPREVRHEVIFRLKDLEEWTDLDLRDAQRLSPDQVVGIKSEAADFFATRNPVTIDGTAILPDAVQVARLSVGPEGLRILPDQAEAERTTMLLGVVLSYPNKTLANRVDMNWQLFPAGVDTIPVTLSDPAGSVPSQIYKSDPTVTWNNYLTKWENPQTRPVVVKTAALTEVPLVALGLGMIATILLVAVWRSRSAVRTVLIAMVGAFTAAAFVTLPLKHPVPFLSAPQLDEIATHQVVQALLDNVSLAMLEPREEALTKALEPFVDQAHQKDVRTEIRRGLSVTLPSGAMARTDDILDLQVEDFTAGEVNNKHRVLANWKAQVSGSHWGHLHRQAVRFRGLLNLSRDGDQWLLDGLTVLTAQKEG